MRFILLSALALFVTFGFAVQAKADYFVWQDSDTGASLSWPDSWKKVNNSDPDDVVTIMAPSGRGHAFCRVRVRKDMRFAVYPPKYSPSVQKIAYSHDFWEKYLAEYNDHDIRFVEDGAGLGRGFASYAMAEYTSAVQGPEMRRRALMFVSNYNDMLYIFECSAHKDAFARWKALFLSIAGSVDFQKAHHEIRSGHYPHDFTGDRRIRFRGTEGPNRIVY